MCILNILLLVIVAILLFKISKSDEYYIPAPVVSQTQDYSWAIPGNPSIGFAPATHLIRPSRKECSDWVRKNFTNPDEAYSEWIECLQNGGMRVWTNNML